MEALFSNCVQAEDIEYRNICEGDWPPAEAAKQFVENLWQIYHPYADAHFLKEIKRNFHARFWEMYLTCAFLDQGFVLSCLKPGPDILINHSNRKIWLEAVTSTSGDPSKPDSVPESKMGVVQSVPNEQIILRYRNAISEKFDRAYFDYLNKQIVQESDCYVVAVNGRRSGFAVTDRDPPRIIQALFPIGNQEVVIEWDTKKVIENRFQYRPVIEKRSGASVSTSIFLSSEYVNLSAVLFSNIDSVNRPDKTGHDFMLVHNPLAKNPLPENFLKLGREYFAKIIDGNKYQISFIDKREI